MTRAVAWLMARGNAGLDALVACVVVSHGRAAELAAASVLPVLAGLAAAAVVGAGAIAAVTARRNLLSPHRRPAQIPRYCSA